MLNIILKNKQKLIRLIYIIIFIIILSSTVTAKDFLTASSYEIRFQLDHPEKVVSDVIEIRRNIKENQEKVGNENIYMGKFKLIDKDNNEIDPKYIVVETPYYHDTLDSVYQFLILKKNHEKTWIKIKLLPKAIFVKPGLYEGFVKIPGIDWEIKVKVKVKPYTSITLIENNLNVSIDRPYLSNFFVAPELCKLQIDTNYNNWQLFAQVLNGSLLTEQGTKIEQQQIFYRIDSSTISGNNTPSEYNKNDFQRMKEKGASLIIDGDNYRQNLIGIHFGVELGEDWTSQPAGKYTGIVLFTLEGRR